MVRLKTIWGSIDDKTNVNIIYNGDLIETGDIEKIHISRDMLDKEIYTLIQCETKDYKFIDIEILE